MRRRREVRIPYLTASRGRVIRLGMDILDAIGNTSLVRLRKAGIFVKLESENPTGSMKDRMALSVIARAEADGRLRPGDAVVEYTGGSTGTSLALVCAAKGYRIRIVTSDAFSQEKRDHMAALGADPAVRIIAVEPAESAVLAGGTPGPHEIEGVGIGYLPPLWEPGLVDGIVAVASEEAKEMTRRLAREEALFAGTSTGANVVAALRIAERLGPAARIVTLAADSGLKYLSTDVYGRASVG